MVKRIYHWSPHYTKKAANKKANELRKKGQKVRVTKAKPFSRHRGFKWDCTVTGVRKRKK